MPDFVTTIIAALIGSVIGSVGAVFADYWLTQRKEKLAKREIILQRYLFQLQDAIEMFYYRLNNVAFSAGGRVMSDEYFEVTTLYAFGKVLALERIFLLDAVYTQLDGLYPELGTFLRVHRLDRNVQYIDLYQYDRIALAESIIEREGEVFRTSTYLEFRKRYEMPGSREKQWLEPAVNAITSLSPVQIQAMLKFLKIEADRIAKRTGIDSSLNKDHK
ncbi:hypothetical protein [Tengunoibacter tsumagoiensis]|uniref:Uncharacterized protein n=1 Tax=Tengunoibacter tsumagoiensis TaxID=2014871 RepID=A0A401ZY83_9CHLR|nr:hypothetical protein [Tengunoibacter tsumagoiensis]GCE11809.1 hypothetical protein KTT_16680 [Tengunoibacter tsumagoiensis]